MAEKYNLDQNNTDTRSLICCICSDIRQPKLLPCQHSFCADCLQKQCSYFGDREALSCPECQMKMEPKENLVAELPENFLFPILKEEGLVSGQPNCDSCRVNGSQSKATHKCLDCGDSLCLVCSSWHCRPSISRHHVVVLIEELSKSYLLEWKAKKRLNCNHHSTTDQRFVMEVYCEGCNCLICQTCLVHSHKDHCYKISSDVIEGHRSEFQKEKMNLHMQLHQQKIRVQTMETMLQESKTNNEKAENEVHATALEVHALVDRIKVEKLEELKKCYDEVTKKITNTLEGERNIQKRIEATINFAEDFYVHSTDADFLMLESDVTFRIKSTGNRRSNSFERPFVLVKRTTSNAATVTAIIADIFGKVQCKKKTSVYKCKPYSNTPHVVFNQIVDLNPLLGLAVNREDEIIAVGNGGILSFDKHGKLLSNIEHNAFLSDVATDDQYVYLAERTPRSRQVIVAEKNGSIHRKIPLPEEEQGHTGAVGIAVDSKENIFVTGDANTVYKCVSNSTEFHPFISPTNQPSFKSPFYLCVAPEDKLVVGCQNKVQTFESNGEMSWEYGGTLEKTLENVTGICCDEISQVYIASFLNPEVHVVLDGTCMYVFNLGNQVARVRPMVILKDEGQLVYSRDNFLTNISVWK